MKVYGSKKIHTCWLGNWAKTDVILLEYIDINFLIFFSTLLGILPEIEEIIS